MQAIKSAPPNNSGNLIFLSLFLLLLAFFILLNALATIEETKARKVLTSVATTFRSVVDSKTQAQILISDLGPTPQANEVLDALQQLWITSAPIAKVEKLTRGQIMEMTLPVNELFLGGKAMLRADREPLFDRTSLLLGLKSGGGATEVRIVLGVTRDQGILSSPEGRLAVDRAGQLAAAFVDHETPEDRVTVGVQEGDPKKLRVRFEIRDPAQAQATFKSGGDK
jgi:hypothetical protein